MNEYSIEMRHSKEFVSQLQSIVNQWEREKKILNSELYSYTLIECSTIPRNVMKRKNHEYFQ